MFVLRTEDSYKACRWRKLFRISVKVAQQLCPRELFPLWPERKHCWCEFWTQFVQNAGVYVYSWAAAVIFSSVMRSKWAIKRVDSSGPCRWSWWWRPLINCAETWQWCPHTQVVWRWCSVSALDVSLLIFAPPSGRIGFYRGNSWKVMKVITCWPSSQSSLLLLCDILCFCHYSAGSQAYVFFIF